MEPDPLPVPPPPRGITLRDLILPVGLSLAVLGVVLAVTYEPAAFVEMTRTLRPGYLVAAFVMLGVQLSFGAFRLRHIGQGEITLGGGYRGQIAWDFMSAVTPSAIGGAPLASYFVAKDNGLEVGRATAFMLFSMLLDQVWFAFTIPTILTATIFLDVFPPALGDVGAGTLTVYMLCMMGWAVFFAYATLIRPEIVEKVARWAVKIPFLKRFEEKVHEEAEKMKDQAKIIRRQPPVFFAKGFLFAAGVWLSRYTIVLLIALSVAPSLNEVEFMFRTAALWISALVMPTPGGSGGVEGLYLLFLSPLLPRAVSGAVLLTWRLLTYHLIIGLGLFVTMRTVVVSRKRAQRAHAAQNGQSPVGSEAEPAPALQGPE